MVEAILSDSLGSDVGVLQMEDFLGLSDFRNGQPFFWDMCEPSRKTVYLIWLKIFRCGDDLRAVCVNRRRKDLIETLNKCRPGILALYKSPYHTHIMNPTTKPMSV